MKPDINVIKARLGSISKTKMKTLPLAVQVLLTKDLPELLKKIGDKHGVGSLQGSP